MSRCVEIAQLKATIAALDLPVDGEVLVDAFGAIDLLTAKVSAALGAFDAAELWDLEGASSVRS